jgi:hypothetical protein
LAKKQARLRTCSEHIDDPVDDRMLAANTLPQRDEKERQFNEKFTFLFKPALGFAP